MIPDITTQSDRNGYNSTHGPQRSSSPSQEIFQKTIAQTHGGVEKSTKTSSFSKHDPELLAQIDQENTSLPVEIFQRTISDEFLSSKDSSPVTTDETSSLSRHDPELLLQVFHEEGFFSHPSSRSNSFDDTKIAPDNPEGKLSIPKESSPSETITPPIAPAKPSPSKLSKEQARDVFERIFKTHDHKQLATAIVEDRKDLLKTVLKHKQIKFTNREQLTSLIAKMHIHPTSDQARDLISKIGTLNDQMEFRRKPDETLKKVLARPNAQEYILKNLSKPELVRLISLMSKQEQFDILIASSSVEELRELLVTDSTDITLNKMNANQQYELFKRHLSSEEFAQLYPEV